MSLRTLAVVVTYNRCELLKRCLDYIERQLRQPDGILVINNGCIDDTEVMLRNRGIRCLTQENVGSAGGWFRGIQYALDEGFDAVWLMDDDGFPEIGALAALDAAMVTGVVCASSVVLREDQPTHFVFPFPVLDGAGLPIILGRIRKISTLTELRTIAQNGTYPYAHFFNGALISMAAVRKVGNVNRDFFIFGEEVDYFFRLRRSGKVISVLDAEHFHPDVSQRPYTPAKVYYYIKNTLVLNALYFNMVWLRHWLAVLVVLARTFSRNGLGTVLSYILGRNSIIFYMAILRGLKGKVGKDFNG